MIKKYLRKQEGITGTDLVMSVVVIMLFIGILTSLMSNIYKTSAEIQASSNAMAYATIVSEKIDEKSFEEVINNANFADYLKNIGEISVDDDYRITTTHSIIAGVDENYIRKVEIVVRYEVLGVEKTVKITKLKVKEVE